MAEKTSTGNSTTDVNPLAISADFAYFVASLIRLRTACAAVT